MPLGGQTSSAPCQETPVVINCETEGEVCAGATCVPCLPAEPVAPLCSGAELAALPQELADLDQLMTHTGANDLLFPIVLYRLRFCDGSRRYVFDRELGGIDADYVMEQRLIVRSAADLYRLTYNNGASGQIGAVDVILSQRPGNNGLLITPLPPLQQSSAPGDPLSGDNPGNEGDGRPQVSYYNYDHLGNTRVVYHSVINCVSDSVHYVLEYAADYYPFGSILREWSNCEKSRFLFTYKERDAETGWDNLGARLYDSDVCRFLGVDPLGGRYLGWSSFNYCFNNPIRYIDPDGRSVDDVVYYNSKGEEVNRIVTDERYETYIDLKDDGYYSLAPMPNIVEGFEDPKYQKYDYLIAAHTAIFNNTAAEDRPTTPNGLSLDGDQPTVLSPTLIKAIILKETQAGTIDGSYNQKGTSDIMQANVQTMNNGAITGSDWSAYKASFGLVQGGSATPEQSIFAGIRILYTKGLVVEKAAYSNGALTSDSRVSWKGGNLNSWWEAVKSYNASSYRGSYVKRVYNYWNNSFFSKDSKYYKK